MTACYNAANNKTPHADGTFTRHPHPRRWCGVTYRLPWAESCLRHAYTGNLHDIVNAQSGESVTFNHNRKVKTVLKKQVVIDAKTGDQTEHAISVPKEADFFARFRQIPDDATEQLPKQKIEDRDAIGFRSVEQGEDGTWTRTYWVAPKSKLPIQIVIDFKSKTKGLMSSRWVQSQFVFDSKIDDELFSAKTPDGYTAKDGTVFGLDF